MLPGYYQFSENSLKNKYIGLFLWRQKAKKKFRWYLVNKNVVVKCGVFFKIFEFLQDTGMATKKASLRRLLRRLLRNHIWSGMITTIFETSFNLANICCWQLWFYLFFMKVSINLSNAWRKKMILVWLLRNHTNNIWLRMITKSSEISFFL